ncbi:MAG: TIGR04282 family arsenosugar biosynthesis glycosyltransferase, partial [Planctomycetaceae bacterium]
MPDSEPLSQFAITRSLGMFSKYWHVGQVKTRLARDIGADAAAHIHRLWTLHLTQRLLAPDYKCILFTTPDSDCPRMQAAVGDRWSVRPQGPGDLGQRMANAFQATMNLATATSRTDVVLVGADLPSLTASDIEA